MIVQVFMQIYECDEYLHKTAGNKKKLHYKILKEMWSKQNFQSIK
jgi:hypothetical protein